MRLVVALGGNALLRRDEELTVENQRSNMQQAAAGLARACAGNDVAIVHGNGPQVGLLALEAEAFAAVPAYPLDVLGAESQGMVGYVIAQELRNAMPARPVAGVLTQTLIDTADPAFARPTKPIGPVYPTLAEARARVGPGKDVAADGDGYRRVVPSPPPLDVVELDVVSALIGYGVVTVCCGGGGIPVARSERGRLCGVEAVIDKDLTAALLARRLGADVLLILTDVDAVYGEWGTPHQHAIRHASARELSLLEFAEGSMKPKVQAATQFVMDTGQRAAIGNLQQIGAVLSGDAGTQISGGGPR